MMMHKSYFHVSHDKCNSHSLVKQYPLVVFAADDSVFSDVEPGIEDDFQTPLMANPVRPKTWTVVFTSSTENCWRDASPPSICCTTVVPEATDDRIWIFFVEGVVNFLVAFFCAKLAQENRLEFIITTSPHSSH